MLSLFLDALNCCNESRPPVWLMRQAGRHLASYRALRSRYSFLEMCHEPELIAQVTLLPIDAYQMDAAILFSDILVIPEAMGVGLLFEENKGPIIERPVQTAQDIENLPSATNLSALNYVFNGIRCVKPQLNVPLVGFCGAPFTIASYLIEGKSSRDLKKTKQWMFRDPESFHRLLDKLTEWSIAYLRSQIAAGVNAVQIFDSWANYLAFDQFQEFSQAYLQKILVGIQETKVPAILFCRGSSVFAPQLATLQPAGIGVDWNCDLAAMRQCIPKTIALQGNLDPDVLYAPLSVIEKTVNRLLDRMQGDQGFIFNLGHGISPDVSEEAVRTLVECVKRREYCHAISSY
jgi:uroporphyrinogen decarboxylase